MARLYDGRLDLHAPPNLQSKSPKTNGMYGTTYVLTFPENLLSIHYKLVK